MKKIRYIVDSVLCCGLAYHKGIAQMCRIVTHYTTIPKVVSTENVSDVFYHDAAIKIQRQLDWSDIVDKTVE